VKISGDNALLGTRGIDVQRRFCCGVSMTQISVVEALAVARRYAKRYNIHNGLGNGIAFGLRGEHLRPHFIRYTTGRVRRDGPSGDCFEGFDVWDEVRSPQLASAWGDRFRRAFGSVPKQAWPGWPGSFVQVKGIRHAGTLGCFVQSAKRPDVYAVTCRHVVEQGGKIAEGVVVESFVPHNGGRRREIGVVDSSMLREYGITADIALIRITDPSVGENVVPALGRIGTSPTAIEGLKLGSEVGKYGAQSGYSAGYLSAVEVPSTAYEQLTGMSRAEVTPIWDERRHFASFCSLGDSGSVVTSLPQSGYRASAIGVLVGRETLLERGYIIGLADPLRQMSMQLLS
jgi:hypothetical protein